MYNISNGIAQGKENPVEEEKKAAKPHWFCSRSAMRAGPARDCEQTGSGDLLLPLAATEQHTDEEVAELVSWLGLLVDEGQVVELRALRVSTPGDDRQHTEHGFFDSDHREQMAQAALQLTENAEGVYFTLNPVKPALLNSCPNQVVTAGHGNGTTDNDVLCRRWLLIDADPQRQGGSATDEEKGKGEATIQQVRNHLDAQGWPEPILADSGNGYHLLYRIDLPVDDAGLVKRVLKSLDTRFSSKEVKIDPAVANPSRICKLYGTMARKGKNTEDRPHRKSKILTIPAELNVVPQVLLEALAAEVKPASTRPALAPGMIPEITADREALMRRARAYLSKIPGAISGQGGHDQTFHVACVLVRDFALSMDEASPLILEWNKTCVPPWDEKDLRRKLTEADKKEGPRGSKLPPSAAVREAGSVDAVKQDDDPHRLARLFLANRYTADAELTLRCWRDEWWRWENGCYRVVTEAELRAELWADIEAEFNRINKERRSRWADQVAAGEIPAGKTPCANKVCNSLVSNVLGALSGLTTVRNDIEQPTWLIDGRQSKARNYIAVSNGLLDVEALLADQPEAALQPHSPLWFSPVCLPYPFDPQAACPKWEMFLQRNLEADPERIALLQEWFGYDLLPDTSQQRFLVLEGEGSNGKSVACSVLTAVLGEGNVSHVSLEAFGERFALKQTLGKLANIASEVGEIDRVAEGKLKSFTSGDRMTFDRKGIDAIEALPTARLVLATNNRPRFSDRSGGVWRRMLLMPFRVQILPEEKVYGMDKPSWWMQQGELSGIFNWALAGLKRLRKQNRFTEPAVCQEAIHEYRAECNPARAFLHEFCETKGEGSVGTGKLYEGYRNWCEDNGYQPLGAGMFGKEVGRAFPGVMKKRGGSRANRQHTYEGLDYQGLPFHLLSRSTRLQMG